MILMSLVTDIVNIHKANPATASTWLKRNKRFKEEK